MHITPIQFSSSIFTFFYNTRAENCVSCFPANHFYENSPFRVLCRKKQFKWWRISICRSFASVGEKDYPLYPLQIIELMRANPKVSAKVIAEKIGISSRNVEANIQGLKKQGIIDRIGSAKGGHWVVKQGKNGRG